jgi:hypothetical protein
LQIERVPLERAIEMIADGEIEDAKTIIGIMLAAPRLGLANISVNDFSLVRVKAS